MSEEKKDMIAEAVELLKAANEEEVYALLRFIRAALRPKRKSE